ncbi:unnamed protein product, partial [marine sediment metagenome]
MKSPSVKLSKDCKKQLSRAVKSPEFEEFCTDCLNKGDVLAIMNLFHAVSEEHGDCSWYS